MKELAAIGVSAGLGIGKAYVLEKKSYVIPRDPVSDVAQELIRFETALSAVLEETKQLAEKARQKSYGSTGDIMDAYLTLLSDPAVTEGVRELISATHNAAEAVEIGIGSIVSMFESMDDAYMRDRVYDILDIQNRILEELLGVGSKFNTDIPPGAILVAEDLTTSDTARMDLAHVAGIITAHGGQNSHASIVARSMDIPAVVGAESILEAVCDGDDVLLDGHAGEVYVSPTRDIAEKFYKRHLIYLSQRELTQAYFGRASLTRDEVRVNISANIGSVEDLPRVFANGADGIGLFRSEFLYENTSRVPDEKNQFEAYRSVVMAMKGKPVTIRTMDIGSDKPFFQIHYPNEENPALGYRGIRIQLDRTDLFRTQLRAILRASNYGNVRLKFPMISSVEELREAKKHLYQAMEELHQEGVPFDRSLVVGVMIEVPSAFMMADVLARECDFFSIGTNDLIQYVTATDRTNAKVAHLYSHYHPAALRMIAQTVKIARKSGIRCGICGEAAGDLLLIPALLGMGATYFSTNTGSILKNRRLIAGLTMPETKLLANDVLNSPTSLDVKKLLESFRNSHRELYDFS